MPRASGPPHVLSEASSATAAYPPKYVSWPARPSQMIITISGPHGTGKSTYAAHLAGQLGLRHVSAGLLFRRLAKGKHLSLQEFGQVALEDPSVDKRVDEETLKEGEKGNVVVDGQLAGWVLRTVADLRIYLTTPEKVRMERIAKRDGASFEDARKQTLHREKVQSERYHRHYGFMVEDQSIYHLVIDTSLLPKEDTARILLMAARAVKSKTSRSGSKKA